MADYELQISDQADKGQIKKIMDAIETYGVSMVDPDDYDQLYSHLDQMYVDYKFGDNLVTLHFEHYLGIFFFQKQQILQHLKKFGIR